MVPPTSSSPTTSTRRILPPGPLLQRINDLLHQEPLSTILYGLYWSLLIALLSPVAVWVLLGRTVVQVVSYLKERSEKATSTTPSSNAYDPTHHSDEELAVLVTGCDSGFGKEIVIWAAHAGFTVFAGCLEATSFEQFRDLSSVVPLLMDVTKGHHVETAVAKVREWLSTAFTAENSKEETKKTRVFHALVNNAGIGYAADIDWMTMEEIQKTMDVNFLGLVRCCKAFLPIFKQQSSSKGYKGARILNLTSMAGLVPSAPLFGVYAASKFAAQAFSEALRSELDAFHIQVTTINPSFHQTPICDNTVAKVQQQWDKLPVSLQQEYGREYIEQSKELGHELVTRALWNMSVVVDQVVQSLKRSQLPARILVGTDARFGMIALRMFPDWLIEQFFRLVFPRPTPAVMMMRNQSKTD